MNKLMAIEVSGHGKVITDVVIKDVERPGTYV